MKKGYEHVINLVKDENFDLLGDSHSVLNRWKNFICQQNVNFVKDVRQTDVHTHLSLYIPVVSSFKSEFAINSFKTYKSSFDKILEEFVQVGGNILHFEIHTLIEDVYLQRCYTMYSSSFLTHHHSLP
jgi:hypothetical protein